MPVFQKLNTLTTSTLRSEKVPALSLVYSSRFFWFFGLNKCQFWCLECFVSQSLNHIFCRELKANTDNWVSATGQRPAYQESTTISSQKSSRAENFDTGNQYKDPPPVSSPFLKSSWAQWREKLSWSFCSSALGSSESRPSLPATAAVLSNLWKPKPSNLGSDAPYSECVWEGERDRDMSDTVNCCSSPQSLNLI